jgi:hypothetical protein
MVLIGGGPMSMPHAMMATLAPHPACSNGLTEGGHGPHRQGTSMPQQPGVTVSCMQPRCTSIAPHVKAHDTGPTEVAMAPIVSRGLTFHATRNDL